MRIFHVIKHCTRGHGNVHVAVDLACAQAAQGDDVYILSGGGDLESVCQGAGVHSIMFKHGKSFIGIISAVARLLILCAKNRPDVIHAHMMSSAIIAYIVSRILRVSLVTSVHNSFDGHSFLMRLGDRVVSVSSAEFKLLESRGFPRRSMRMVLNGPIGSPRLAGREETVPLSRPNITTVCGLHGRKGVNDLIVAFSIIAPFCSDATLNIVGDGPDRHALETLAQRTGFSNRIRFVGGTDDPVSYLRSSDIFVLASLREPFGLVNIEARLAGCALVCTSVGGIPEALDFGEAGILVPACDPVALSSVLLSLLQDHTLLSEMKKRAGKNLSRFSSRRMADNYGVVYREILGRI